MADTVVIVVVVAEMKTTATTEIATDVHEAGVCLVSKRRRGAAVGLFSV
jgi:hypothetical protein